MFKNKQTRFLVLLQFLLIFPLFFCQNSLFPITTTQDHSKRIILNLTDTPETSQAVTWRTNIKLKHPSAQIMLASSKGKFDYNEKINREYLYIRTIKGKSEIFYPNKKKTVYHHSVIFDNLKPDTLYQYRVGEKKNWNEWNFFRTASEKRKPFKFIYLGDPQNGLKSFCSRMFRSAFSQAPDARFFLIAGDIVDIPWKDIQWEAFFYAAGWIPRIKPFILVPGNHEYYAKDPLKNYEDYVTPFWRPHFTLPENGPSGLEETAYTIDYQGVRFIMLNGNEKLKEQKEWLSQQLLNNPNKWTIITVHQTFYTTTKTRDNIKMRRMFAPLIDKYSVDLVLQGHDHSYARTFKIRKGKIVKDSEQGTVYVNSVSGIKFYPVFKLYANMMKKRKTNHQFYQVISVDKEKLTYEAWTVTGKLFDTFTLKK